MARPKHKFRLNFKQITIMNIKPLADRVLVLPAPAEEKVGGIIIPDTAKEKPQRRSEERRVGKECRL